MYATTEVVFDVCRSVRNDARINLLKETRQTSEHSWFYFQHVLAETSEIVDEVYRSACVKTVVKTGNPFRDVTERKIRERNIGVVNRNRLPQRFDAVDDVTMTQARAFRWASGARCVNHDGDVVRLRAFSAFL